MTESRVSQLAHEGDPAAQGPSIGSTVAQTPATDRRPFLKAHPASSSVDATGRSRRMSVSRRRRVRDGFYPRTTLAKIAANQPKGVLACPQSSPARSATSPSSVTAAQARPRSSRRCCSRPARRTGSASSSRGSTISDWDEDEQQRQMSIADTLCHLEWQGRKINLIDTPGEPQLPGRRDRRAARRRGRPRHGQRRDGRRGADDEELEPGRKSSASRASFS